LKVFQIRPHNLLRTAYHSISTLALTPQLLRCNPNFHGRPREDTALIKLPNGRFVFARIRFMFSCTALHKQWDLALATLFATVISPSRHPTGQRVVREDSDSIFIDVDWIVRSAFLASASLVSHPNDYFVCDTVDSDMYWRLREISEQCI